MSDVVAQAKAALDEYRRTTPNIYTLERYRALTLEICTLVPELVAEIERLRAVTDIIDPDSVYREQRDQARAEVDHLRAIVARGIESGNRSGGYYYALRDALNFIDANKTGAEGREESTTIPLPEQLCTKPGAVGTTAMSAVEPHGRRMCGVNAGWCPECFTEDDWLAALAAKRLANDNGNRTSLEDVMEELGCPVGTTEPSQEDSE